MSIAYKHRIELVVCFGSLWYVLKDAGAPVLADEAALPDRVDTTGTDFAVMGFLADEFPATAMMVIRNVTVPNGDLRKITWGGGFDAPFIDLGSGKAAVVDPASGTQRKSGDLPDDIHGVAALLRDLMGLSSKVMGLPPKAEVFGGYVSPAKDTTAPANDTAASELSGFAASPSPPSPAGASPDKEFGGFDPTDLDAGSPVSGGTRLTQRRNSGGTMAARNSSIKSNPWLQGTHSTPPVARHRSGTLKERPSTAPAKAGSGLGSASRSKSFKGLGQAPKCGTCNKSVYQMEKLEAEGVAYHKVI